jgi:hypothetical protein
MTRQRASGDPQTRREQIAAQTADYLAKGGQVSQADPGRRNPTNEDRHNTFLFLGRPR